MLSSEQEKKKSSDATWLRTVLTSGTFSDKIAALTVLIQESPVHTLTSLDTLVGMVKKKGRRQVNMAVGAWEQASQIFAWNLKIILLLATWSGSVNVISVFLSMMSVWVSKYLKKNIIPVTRALTSNRLPVGG